MVFPEGHEVNKKLTTPELCKIAYASYCAHLAKGKSKKSWNLKTPVKLTWQTMETYIKQNPDIFNPEDKEIAFSDGMNRWEQIVEDSAEGKNRKANTATLQMLMRNKYGWDKNDNTQTFDAAALQASSMLLDQVQKLQIAQAIPLDPSINTPTSAFLDCKASPELPQDPASQ